MNPDQTPTPETPSEWKEMYFAMRDQRDTARAEAKAEICIGCGPDGNGTPEMVSTKEYLHLIEGQRDRARAELAALRATRDADHGAAIEAEKIRPIYDHLCLLKTIHPHFVQLEWLDTLKALITNSQQKGGEEPCAQTHAEDAAESTEHTPTTAASPVRASNAAPTSDPEGAATISDALDRALTIQIIARRKQALGDKTGEVTEEEIQQEIDAHAGTASSRNRQ